MKRSEFIDYAKGYSILTIILYHFFLSMSLPKILGYAVNFGGAGVHLFFFASGFGLMMSKFNGYADFLKRRFSKVLKPYYVTILIIFCTNLFLHIYPVDWGALLAHLLLYKMFVPKYEESYGSQFWFISTILQFYLIFPLLFKLSVGINNVRFVVGAFLISITFSILLSLSPYSNERVFNCFFLQYLWEFALGMMIAKSNSLPKLISKPLFWYIIVSFLGLTTTAILALKGGRTGKNFNDITSFLGYTSISIIVFRISRPLKKFIIWVSTFSYSLYLIHLFTFFIVRIFIKQVDIFTVTLSFALTLIIGFIYDLFLIKIDKISSPKKEQFKPSAEVAANI